MASDYPPGYVISSQCQEDDKVKVCAQNQQYGQPHLTVEYKASFAGKLSAHIKLNGRFGFFSLVGNSITLNNYQNVHRCLVVKAGEVFERTHQYPPCPEEFSAGVSTYSQRLVWYSQVPLTTHAELFFYARNGHAANDWDVEVAFVNERGEWDSKNGENYRFTFKAR